MQFDSSTQMNMLGNIIDYENLEISQENVYDGSCMSIVYRLQLFYKETWLTRVIFRAMYRKLALLKRIFWEKKKSMVDQCFDKVQAL